MTDDQKPGITLVMNSNQSSARALIPPGAPATAAIKDPIPDVPVVQGPHGRAWLCNLAEGRRIMNVPKEKDCGLDHWIVEAPWAHPAWHSYSILLMHLREIPGQPRPHFHIPEATHEMLVHAMNPDEPRNALLSNGLVRGHWLTPANFGAQFIEITDELARERVRKSVQMICDGKLSPDTDFTKQWIALYNNSMIKKGFR